MLEGGWHSGLSVLLLGFGIGMQHALEADHVAAVSSIASKETSMRRIVALGAFWGLGHTLTLMLFAGGAIAFGLTIDGPVAGWLELLVGLMLVGLGGHAVGALIRERIHFHTHRHTDGTRHWHAHSHRDETSPHNSSGHAHVHRRDIPMRSLFIGMVHGMAGSSALVVVTAATVGSVALGLGYVFLFGVGSIFGMAMLSTIIAVPFSWSARALGWANGCLRSGVGVATVILGIVIVMQNLPVVAGV
jgi:hypothetical protein